MMQDRIAIVSLLGGLILFAGCGKDGASVKTYQYEMTYNGCSTGSHSFSDKGEYCKALLNDGLNNGCAFKMRLDRYQAECQ